MPFVGEIGIITKYILTALEQIKKISKPKELSTCVSGVYDFFSFLQGSWHYGLKKYHVLSIIGQDIKDEMHWSESPKVLNYF